METKGYVDSLVKKFYGKSYDEEHEVIQSIMNKLIREDMGVYVDNLSPPPYVS